MDILILLLLAVMPAFVVMAALTDLTSMKIPNWISGGLILAYFPVAFVVGVPLATIGISLGVALAALFVGMALFALRWLGGGDAKLIAAACLWLGLNAMAPFLLYTALAGGLLCLVLIMMRARSQPYLAKAPGWVSRLMTPKGDIPYGVAIAAGALLAYPSSALVETFIAG